MVQIGGVSAPPNLSSGNAQQAMAQVRAAASAARKGAAGAAPDGDGDHGIEPTHTNPAASGTTAGAAPKGTGLLMNRIA